MAGQRSGELLADHVVREQEAAALHTRVEGEEDVLAVGRADHPLVVQGCRVHRGGGSVERLVRPRGQVVAAGEDDSLVRGEAAARLPDAVEAHHGPGERVDDQVAVRVLFVGADAEQHQGAHARVRRPRRRGTGAVRRPARRSPLPCLGVVLDLDGEGATDRLDEDLALEGDVRVAAEYVVLAGRLVPLEVVRGREDVIALTARVQEDDAGRPPRGPTAVRGCRRPSRRSGRRPATCRPTSRRWRRRAAR